jgi:hypothetical protein
MQEYQAAQAGIVMTPQLLSTYAPAIRDMATTAIADPLSTPALAMEQLDVAGRAIHMLYAPFDHVNRNAKIAIVGMTPGRFQAANALRAAQEALRAGQSVESAAEKAKVFASFSGEPMRGNLVRMLDLIGVADLLGLPSTSSLWGGDSDLVHFTSALQGTGYWVYFQNSKAVTDYPSYVNTVPGFYGDGYFTTRGTLKQSSYNSNHYIGMPVCKSGMTTGFTCGTVQSSSVSGTDDRGVSYSSFVKVSGSSQQVIAFGGDSGAPVFSYPNGSYEIVAYGILKGGSTDAYGRPCTGSACSFSYMPIDRVNDRVPFLIHTTQGLLVP